MKDILSWCFPEQVAFFSKMATQPGKLAEPVDLLILGGGWTYTFLQPLLNSQSQNPPITHLATTRDGRSGTLKWEWHPEDNSVDCHGQDQDHQYLILPRASTVVIVFPIKMEGAVTRLVEGYERVHGEGVRWIQLGSTGIFDGGPTLTSMKQKIQPLSEPQISTTPKLQWTDRHSPYDLSNDRAKSEDELLKLRSNSFVLNLSGLWGGTRDPANWIPRIASTKEAVANKGSLHLIHGLDVARAIIAVHFEPEIAQSSSPSSLQPELSNLTETKEPREREGMGMKGDKERYGKRKGLQGKRYILTDLRVYDWWDLISAWTSEIKYQFKDLKPPSSSTTSSIRPSKEEKGDEEKLQKTDLIESITHTQDPSVWIQSLMRENHIKALPRPPEELGRALDSRAFWEDFKIEPVKGRWERARL